MTSLIVPSIIAAASLVGLGVVLHLRAQARLAFEKALVDRGFSQDDDAAGIDFSITPQWADARGMTYLNRFTKELADSALTVANVRCWEMTGTRVRKVGAIMRADEICQTVLSCCFPDRELPRFCLCGKDSALQLQNLVEGGAEIVTGDAAFDRAFFIVGPGDADATAVLTQGVRQRMLSLSDVMVSSGNGSVLLFRQGAVLSPEELGRFLDLLELVREELTTGPA